MSRGNWLLAFGCCLLGLAETTLLRAQDRTQSEVPAQKSQPSAPNPSELLQLGTAKAGDLLQGMSDLRQTAEASQKLLETLERVMPNLGPLVLGVTENISRLSSDFDPFGYKTAFRTIQKQNEIIERQQQLIQELQQREIERLQRELGAGKRKSKRRKDAPPKAELSD